MYKMKIKVFFLILLSVLTINSLNAQKNNKRITITGTVLNSAKQPITNAIVMIDGEKTNSLTDFQGKFKVKVKPNAAKIGIFTFGSGIKEEEIGGRTEIDFNFGGLESQSPRSTDQTVAPGQQGVNTGYGMVKEKNLTTTVDKIDGTDKKYGSYHSIADMIQREVPGVRINGSSVIIQDSKDLFGSVYALVVVDGVYMNELPDISPSTVKSIEVLKGTSAAMYGSRGYGGVIVIKTKLQND
jgi:TonB-dependent SusC/RagA subfamily outer membrane receptor